MQRSSSSVGVHSPVEHSYSDARRRFMLIILASHTHLGWDSIHAALHGQEHLQIVDNIASVADAEAAMVRLRPDILVIAGDAFGDSLRVIVGRLHTCCPTSKLIVLVHEIHEPFLPLVDAGLTGYLQWTSLTPATLRQCLLTVLETNLLIASPAAVAHHPGTEADDHYPATQPAVFSRYELDVLQCLAVGVAPGKIATHVHLSIPTVNRALASLKVKCGAPTLFALGIFAVRHHLVSLDPMIQETDDQN